MDILRTQGNHIAGCIDWVIGNGQSVMDVAEESEEMWVQEVIANRGKSSYSEDCVPGYYNFEGSSTRKRQDGNYNGGLIAYYNHIDAINEDRSTHFECL